MRINTCNNCYWYSVQNQNTDVCSNPQRIVPVPDNPGCEAYTSKLRASNLPEKAMNGVVVSCIEGNYQYFNGYWYNLD